MYKKQVSDASPCEDLEVGKASITKTPISASQKAAGKELAMLAFQFIKEALKKAIKSAGKEIYGKEFFMIVNKEILDTSEGQIAKIFIYFSQEINELKEDILIKHTQHERFEKLVSQYLERESLKYSWRYYFYFTILPEQGKPNIKIKNFKCIVV